MSAKAALNKIAAILMEAKYLPASINEINTLLRTITEELEDDG